MKVINSQLTSKELLDIWRKKEKAEQMSNEFLVMWKMEEAAEGPSAQALLLLDLPLTPGQALNQGRGDEASFGLVLFLVLSSSWVSR